MAGKRDISAAGRTTCVDIARMAGVTATTVSRVLNDPAKVAPVTRDRVLEAIRKTDYRPLHAARILSRQKHDMIGIVLEHESVRGPYGTTFMAGVSEKLTEYRQGLATGILRRRCQPEDVEGLPLLQMVSVDGLVFDLHDIRWDFDGYMGKLGLPYVLVNPRDPRAYNTIMPDDVSAARLATQYLIDRGHRRIAYFACAGTQTHSSQANRMKGYADTLMKSGLAPIPLWDVPPEQRNPHVADHISRVKRYWEEHRCSAIVTYSAFEAIGVLVACYQLGLKVPQDISIVSCDYDTTVWNMPILIQCIDLNRRKMGALAVEMILQRIENPGEDLSTIMVQGELMEEGRAEGESVSIHHEE